MNRRTRRAYDDRWAEALSDRYQRRRHLPLHRVEQAWLEFSDAAVGPLVRWLSRRLR